MVYLAPSTVRVLAGHRERQDQDRELAGSRWKGTGLIFGTMRGRPLKDTYLSALFHETGAVRAAQGPHP